MKKFLGLLLAAAMAFVLMVPTLAANATLTEVEVIAAIENGTAIIEFEAREINSFTEEEIAADAALAELFLKLEQTTRSIRTNTKRGIVYSQTVTMPTSGETVKYVSCPIAQLQISDVGAFSSADVTTTLYIEETCTVNGILTEGWVNQIKYKNIKATVGCGINTAFTSSVRVLGTPSTTDLRAMLGWVTNLAGWSTASQIISGLSLINYPSDYNTTKYISDDYVRAVGAKWKPSLGITQHDDYLSLEGSLSTIDSTLTQNVSTNAAVAWTYDVYKGTVLYTSGIQLQPQTTYIVNAR